MKLYDLTSEQLDTLLNACDKLGVEPNFQPKDLFMPAHRELTNLCTYLDDDLNCLSEAAEHLGWAVHYNDVDDAVNTIDQFVSHYEEVLEDMNRMIDAAKNVVVAFRDLTQCNEFELTCPEEEIRAIIDEHLTDDNQMGVAYQCGKFALLFGQVNDEGIIEGPSLIKVFATGCEAAMVGVNRYIMDIVQPIAILDEDEAIVSD